MRLLNQARLGGWYLGGSVLVTQCVRVFVSAFAWLTVKSWDAFGATEKVTRLNTAPPFLFAAGVLCWLVFRESAGKVLLVREGFV